MEKILLVLLMVVLSNFGVSGQIEKRNTAISGNSKLETAISASIEQAHTFLSDTTQVLDCYVLLHYINRQYGGMPWVLDREQAMRRITETYKNNDDEWYYFLRLTDKETRCPTWQDVQDVTSPIDSITLQALWSDKLHPIKSDFYRSLIKMSQAGSYDLTHAVLACIWLEETKYASVENDPVFAETKLLLINKIKNELLHKVSFWNDVEIEAVALLLYAGEYSSVKREWITQIIEQQRADGGWSFDQGTEPSIPHTSALAIWALEQYRNKTASNTRWIQLNDQQQ